MTGRLVEASDWLTMPGDELLKRMARDLWLKGEAKSAGDNVRELYHNGSVVGRACILPNVGGIVSIGGFRSASALSIAGILKGESARTSRQEAVLLVTDDELASWASEQAKLVPNLSSSHEQRAEYARLIGFLGGDIGELPIAKVGKEWLNTIQLAEWARDRRSILVVTPSDLSDAQQKYAGRLRGNVIVEPRTRESLLDHGFLGVDRRHWQAYFERKTKRRGCDR